LKASLPKEKPLTKEQIAHMAIMHLSVKNGTKGKGAAHAQYIERYGKYSNREDCIASESGNMPSWAKDKSVDFWKAADKYERANGRSYKELEISLPRELNTEQKIQLVQEFTKNVLGDSHAYTWAIHEPKAKDGDTNPHVHIMFCERTNDGVERDAEQYFKRYNANNPELGGAGKDRSFTHKSFVHAVRQEWAETVNHKMQELGIDARIDHRSYKDMNIDLESQNVKRLYANADNVENSAAFAMSDQIRSKQRDNGARIIENPTIALDALTAMKSTFTKRDLEKFVFSYTDGIEQYTEAYNSILASPSLAQLGDDKQKFTSYEMIEIEEKIIDDVKYFSHHKSQERSYEELSIFTDVWESRTFNNEQKIAYNLLMEDSPLAVLNGAAGTGKSYVLGAVNEAYEKTGYKVIGAAIQGTTAQNMERDAGIESRTIASLISRLDKEKDMPSLKQTLDRKTVLIIDEAGMVGSRDMQKIVAHTRRTGATLRLVGDDKQLNAVSAGSAFSKVRDKVGSHNRAELVQIVRQRDKQQQAASIHLSQHNIADGLSVYDQLNKIHALETQQGARQYTVSQWAASNKDKIMLAYTNADVNAMNKAARSILREKGSLGSVDVSASTAKGSIDLAEGDLILFKESNQDIGVLNGTRGTVEKIIASDGKAERLVVKLENGKKADFSLAQYNSLNHAYASTVHSSQGVTVDEAFLLASSAMNANLTYVAATRHRDDLTVVFSREQFKDVSDMKQQLSKAEEKTYTADYRVLEDNERTVEPISERETLADRNVDRQATSKAEFDRKIEEARLEHERRQAERDKDNSNDFSMEM
jgi:Ti-type conjugative transfer relaxase TraA